MQDKFDHNICRAKADLDMTQGSWVALESMYAYPIDDPAPILMGKSIELVSALIVAFGIPRYFQQALS